MVKLLGSCPNRYCCQVVAQRQYECQGRIAGDGCRLPGGTPGKFWSPDSILPDRPPPVFWLIETLKHAVASVRIDGNTQVPAGRLEPRDAPATEALPTYFAFQGAIMARKQHSRRGFPTFFLAAVAGVFLAAVLFVSKAAMAADAAATAERGRIVAREDFDVSDKLRRRKSCGGNSGTCCRPTRRWTGPYRLLERQNLPPSDGKTAEGLDAFIHEPMVRRRPCAMSTISFPTWC